MRHRLLGEAMPETFSTLSLPPSYFYCNESGTSFVYSAKGVITMQKTPEFDEIYQNYAGDLYRFILRLCGNEQLAMDILQDTMLKAFTEIGKFRGECSMKTWLCTLARNLYRDHLKKAENRNLPLEESWNLPAGGDLEERMADRAQALAIHRLLHRLDEPYREIFSLRIFAELSFQEIGQVFGKTENWARVTFFRAKKKLIELLEKEGSL